MPPASLNESRRDAGQVVNLAAYRFVTLDQLPARREMLRELTSRLQLKGTILLSPEGINLFLAGTRPQTDEFRGVLEEDPLLRGLDYKESCSEEIPFERMLVKIKSEIIAFGQPGIDPRQQTSPRIAPRELAEWIAAGREMLLLDVRNEYEVACGTFENARHLPIRHFRQFPEAIAELPIEARDKPVVTFCTGGIRCEKAAPYLEAAGFQQVYQLDGGILRYFEEAGGAGYVGGCFVFDQRETLDPQLHPAGESR